MSTNSSSLFGFSGKNLRLIGIVLLVVGLVMFLAGAVYMLGGVTAPTMATDPSAWFSSSVAHMLGGFVIIAVGMVLMGIGGFALRFGLIRPVTSFVAEEASPALETASMAIGRGWGEARTQLGQTAPPPAAATVIKVKCKNCGYLDSEDATYCSKCGQPL